MSLTQINKAGLDEIALDHVFTIGASGTDHYTFQGEGLNGTVNNPTLYLTRGKTYRFENTTGGHPIRIQSTSGASGTAYNTGVTNNAGSGTVIVEVQHDAPDVLYYQCTSHAAMNGILYITGALADGGVTAAKIGTGAVTEAKIQAFAVTETKIGDQAVTLAKLPHGTSSNDGKFLRANNGADPTFETVTSTTINNNADNRIITGSGSANTLNGEANLFFDGSKLGIGTTSPDQTVHILKGSAGTVDSVATTVLTLENNAASILQFLSPNNNPNQIRFGDPQDNGAGYIDYNHGTNALSFGTASGGEDMRLDSSGRLLVGQTSGSSPLCVSGTDPVIAELHHSDGGTNDQARISLGALSSNPPSQRGVNLVALNNGAGHDFVVQCSASHSVGPSEKIRVKSSGGITFNGDTAEANALDDYEEGTWTPVIGSGTTTIYSARYIKVGNLCTLSFAAYGFSDNSSSTALYFSGLPFTSANESSAVNVGVAFTAKFNVAANLVSYISQNRTIIDFYDHGQTDYDHIRHNHIQGTNTTHRIFTTITYRTA